MVDLLRRPAQTPRFHGISRPERNAAMASKPALRREQRDYRTLEIVRGL
jgi:hypothetical protein